MDQSNRWRWQVGHSRINHCQARGRVGACTLLLLLSSHRLCKPDTSKSGPRLHGAVAGLQPKVAACSSHIVKERRSLDSLSFDDMWGKLTAALRQLPRVYCVADALDEMDAHNELYPSVTGRAWSE